MVKVFQFDENAREFSANTYVVGKVGGNCVIIDLGSTDPTIYHYIESHYESIEGILLTHGHFDHIRGIPALLKHFKNAQIPVYLSKEDAPLLEDPSLNNSPMNSENVKVHIVTVPVTDGQDLILKDFHIKVIATPFHTRGSVCYLFNDDNALFTGDTLFETSIGRTDFLTSQPNRVTESLKKLLTLRETLVVYPGHGSISRLGEERKNNPYLKQIK